MGTTDSDDDCLPCYSLEDPLMDGQIEQPTLWTCPKCSIQVYFALLNQHLARNCQAHVTLPCLPGAWSSINLPLTCIDPTFELSDLYPSSTMDHQGRPISIPSTSSTSFTFDSRVSSNSYSTQAAAPPIPPRRSSLPTHYRNYPGQCSLPPPPILIPTSCGEQTRPSTSPRWASLSGSPKRNLLSFFLTRD